jgi:hypothetical protein
MVVKTPVENFLAEGSLVDRLLLLEADLLPLDFYLDFDLSFFLDFDDYFV